VRHRLSGRIAAVGFTSGDRVVVGHWDESPIGPFVDLMWAEPSGRRVLVVPDGAVGRFITAVYDFDDVVEAPDLSAGWDGRELTVAGAGRRIELTVGRGVPFPPRPLWVTRWVERPIGRLVTGSVTWGTSPTGVREWYPARRVHLVRHARADRDGRDLGALRPPRPPLGVGFSEPPRWATLTEVAPRLEDPTGALDRLVAATGRRRTPGADRG
jgi:hypothetical protein